jgi:hypothetical protein
LSTFNLKSFILAFCSTLLINFIINIFEETAWRGYLTSQLLKLNLNDWKLYLTVGCVWCLWHLPYYLVFLPEADIRAVMPVSRAVYVVVAFTTYLSWTVMFTELFRVTKSVCPCVILHSVEDSLINLLVISGYISIAAGGIFTFNENGEMLSFTTDDREATATDGTSEKVKWLAVCSKYVETNGIRKPTVLQATWHYDDGDLVYFDGKDIVIEFDYEQMK